MKRACPPASGPSPLADARKGAHKDELRRLIQENQRQSDQNEAQRWWRIYWSLFTDLQDSALSEKGGSEIYGSGPYLRTGIGFSVSLLHDFLQLQGKDCVIAALAACGRTLEELDDQESLSALYQSILKELVGKLHHE